MTALPRSHLFSPLLVWSIWFLAPFSFLSLPSDAAEKIKSITLYGQRYVSLQQWARVRGLDFDWNKPNKVVEVKSRWTKMEFNVSSKRSTYNGVSLWLCSAVVESKGALYISERDIEKTVHPILYPVKMAKGKQIKTVAIAAGHGGKDPGNMVNKEQEKKYTLLLAKALKQELVAKGFKVVMTRETDTFIDLEPQAAIAGRARADVFVTVHYNAVADVSPKGIETFALTPAGAVATNGGTSSPRSTGNKNDSLNILLAYHVHKSMLKKGDFEDRGIRRAGFMVLRQLSMPGLLIEGGFMSNPSDARKIYNTAHRKEFARAIADGILKYKSLVERK